MPEPDCFLRYRISAATRNFTSVKSDVCVLAAAARRGFTMVLFTEAVNRQNTFVGGKCVLVCLFVRRLKCMLLTTDTITSYKTFYYIYIFIHQYYAPPVGKGQ